MRDEDLLLHALSKERDQLHERIMHIDRVIKKIKTGEYLAPTDVIVIDAPAIATISDSSLSFPKKAGLKIQILYSI